MRAEKIIRGMALAVAAVAIGSVVAGAGLSASAPTSQSLVYAV